MECTARITPDLLWVGGNDRRLNLFENIFPIPRGVSYNSYLLLDEKTVLVDTVDKAISGVFFDNLTAALDGRQLNYIVVNHMEPDHAATLAEVCERYPGAQVMLTTKGAQMAAQFFGDGLRDRLHAVGDGAELVTGRHHLRFFTAPMVHWPEVMVTWDETDRVLFSADAFGAFGAVVRIARDDHVAAAGKRTADGLPGLAAHDDGVAHRGALEVGEVLGHAPEHLVAAADDAVACGCDDECDLHESLLRRRRAP